MSPRANIGDRVWRLPNTVSPLTAFQEESVCEGPGRGRCKEGVWEQTRPSIQSIGVTLSKFCPGEMIGTLSKSKKPNFRSHTVSVLT